MIFSTMFHKLKEIVRNMFGMRQTIEQTLNMTPAISNKMTEAIDRWTDMYEDNASWLHEPDGSDPCKVVSLGLPSFIASEKARMAVIELQSEITAPKTTEEKENPKYFAPFINPQTGALEVSKEPKKLVEEKATSPEERAKFMNDEYHNKLLPKLRTQLEYGIAKGSLIIKPYVVKNKVQPIAGAEDDSVAPSKGEKEEREKCSIEFDFIQADCFYPFAFDSNGNLKEVAFIQTKTVRDTLYVRLEYHKLVGNKVEITNTAWENTNANTSIATGSAITLGKKIPLTSVREWKDIPERATIHNVDRLLFGYFKMPDANTVDPHSPLGVSGFARAEKLIREADLQYSRLIWEYEGGEMAVDIDRDALKFTQESNGDTHYVNQHLQNRLFRTVDLGESNTYQVFAPALRDNSMINGLNSILMRIEDVVALSRGTISEVAAEARTATEIRVLKQRSYMSNCEIQKALQLALEDTIYAMDVYCTVYNIVGDIVKDKKTDKIIADKIGKYAVSFTWDDSILVDVDTELNKRLSLMNSKISSRLEVRMWYFGETASQAQDALDKIDEESQKAIEQNAMMSSQMGAAIQRQKQLGKEEQPNGQEQSSTPISNQQSPNLQTVPTNQKTPKNSSLQGKNEE